MRRQSLVALVTVIGSLAGGCYAHHQQSLYESWGQQLQALPSRAGTVDDVSLMLGAPPTRCDPVTNQGPQIGVWLNTRAPVPPVVLLVQPNGPAARGGIRPGDTILAVGGQPVSSAQEALVALQSTRQEGKPLQIVTNQGTVTVMPKVQKMEQCYWNIEAGEVAHGGGTAYADQFGGVASSQHAAYERFFRASCRISDGYVAACQWNYQGG